MLRCTRSMRWRATGSRRGNSVAPNEVAATTWATAVASVGCDVAHLARVRQVHGAAVRVVRPDDLDRPVPDADAVITNVSGLAVAVVAADCVPILLADPRTGAVAAVHAGWRARRPMWWARR